VTTFTERRQRVTDLSGVLVLLELSAPSMDAVVRLVCDTQNWTSRGQLYLGLPFRFKLPDDAAGQAPRAVLEIDNIGRDMTADLEALLPGELITATIRITDREDPDDIYQTMVLPMTSVTVSQAVITAQLGADYIMRQQSVRLRYTAFTAPGLF
jgi:hypothetical protein